MAWEAEILSVTFLLPLIKYVAVDKSFKSLSFLICKKELKIPSS